MKMNELIKLLSALDDDTGSAEAPHPWQVGKPYLIRCVTNYVLGRLTQVTDHELVMEDASWVADTGRFAAALSSGTLKEVEVFPNGPVIVGRGAIIDAAIWGHALPRETK